MKLMRHSRGLLVLMMFLSWFFLPLIGKDAVKRFLPAGLFIALIVTIEDIIAKKRKWWWWYEKIHPKLSGIVPFMVHFYWFLVDLKMDLRQILQIHFNKFSG